MLDLSGQLLVLALAPATLQLRPQLLHFSGQLPALLLGPLLQLRLPALQHLVLITEVGHILGVGSPELLQLIGQPGVLAPRVLQLHSELLQLAVGLALERAPQLVQFPCQHLVLVPQGLHLRAALLHAGRRLLPALPPQVLELPVQLLVLVQQDPELVLVPLSFGLLLLSQLLQLQLRRTYEFIVALLFAQLGYPALQLCILVLQGLIVLPQLRQLVGQLLTELFVRPLLQLSAGTVQHHVLLAKKGQLLVELAARHFPDTKGGAVNLACGKPSIELGSSVPRHHALGGQQPRSRALFHRHLDCYLRRPALTDLYRGLEERRPGLNGTARAVVARQLVRLMECRNLRSAVVALQLLCDGSTRFEEPRAFGRDPGGAQAGRGRPRAGWRRRTRGPRLPAWRRAAWRRGRGHGRCHRRDHGAAPRRDGLPCGVPGLGHLCLLWQGGAACHRHGEARHRYLLRAVRSSRWWSLCMRTLTGWTCATLGPD
mmetsp:Transcript_63386/g.175699  ORF Transcript_63386/g.175699 Transcript_63386/m.175699 type:complete len:486 (-) Transcript_63386:132-1589(-)